MSEEKDIQKSHLTTYLFVALGGLVIILIIELLKCQETVWGETFIHVGQALIIGPTISLILDLPSMVSYFKKITIDSLVSQEYLSTLSRNDLLELRKKCTARIHLKETQSVEQGLIEIDESVCELLTQYYHERYRQTVLCRIEGEYVIKKNIIEEVIINPLSGGHLIKYPEKLRSFLFKGATENTNEVFNLIKYNVSSDGKDEIDCIKGGVKVKESASDASDIPYNTVVTLSDKDGNPIIWEFAKSLKVEKVFEVRVPKSDIAFLKRVTIPVKSFRLDYHYPIQGVKLFAACFGTLSFSN